CSRSLPLSPGLSSLPPDNSGRANVRVERLKNWPALPDEGRVFRLLEDAMTRRIEIYDTTLRDGTQGEGFNLSLQDKVLIAQKLDELGVDYIEGGYPPSHPKDEQFFRDVREMKLKHAKVCAFGMTRKRGVKAED